MDTLTCEWKRLYISSALSIKRAGVSHQEKPRLWGIKYTIEYNIKKTRVKWNKRRVQVYKKGSSFSNFGVLRVLGGLCFQDTLHNFYSQRPSASAAPVQVCNNNISLLVQFTLFKLSGSVNSRPSIFTLLFIGYFELCCVVLSFLFFLGKKSQYAYFKSQSDFLKNSPPNQSTSKTLACNMTFSCRNVSGH